MGTLLQMLLQISFLSKLLTPSDRQASYAETVLTSCLTTEKAFEAVQRFELKLSTISFEDENLWIRIEMNAAVIPTNRNKTN